MPDVIVTHLLVLKKISNHFPHFRDRHDRDEATCPRIQNQKAGTPELMGEPMRLAFLCRRTVMVVLLAYKATHGH